MLQLVRNGQNENNILELMIRKDSDLYCQYKSKDNNDLIVYSI